MSLRITVKQLMISLVTCLACSSAALADTSDTLADTQEEAQITTQQSVDSDYGECLESARYEGESIMCMIDAFYKFNDLAEQLPHSDYGNQAYETQLDACSEVEDTPTSLECAILAAKAYLHDGDTMQSQAMAQRQSAAQSDLVAQTDSEAAANHGVPLIEQ